MVRVFLHGNTFYGGGFTEGRGGRARLQKRWSYAVGVLTRERGTGWHDGSIGGTEFACWGLAENSHGEIRPLVRWVVCPGVHAGKDAG